MSCLQIRAGRYRRFFQSVFMLVLILMPLFWLTLKTRYDFLAWTGFSASFTMYSLTPLSLSTRLFAILVSLIPVGVILYILHLLIRLFSFYEQGEIFSAETTALYHKLALSLFYGFFARVIYDALITLTLTYHNPHGHRLIGITIDRLDILMLIVGAITILIASVMRQAKRISDEHTLTI